MNKEPLPQHLQEILTEWENEENKLRREVNNKAALKVFMGLVFAWSFWRDWQKGKHLLDIGMSPVIVIMCVAWLTLRFSSEKRMLTERQAQLMDQLHEAHNLELIPLLLVAVEKLNYQPQIVAQRLAALLRTVKASDAPQLSQHSVKIARVAYNRTTWTKSISRENSILISAALYSLKQIGTKDAIPDVERIANLTNKGDYAPSLVREAQECLPYLHQRAQKQTAEQTLLRPSEPETSADILLRPATAHNQTDSTELLRATHEG